MKLGNFAGKYRFDDIYNLLLSVISYDDVPIEKLSVKSSYFYSAYLSERNLKDKIEAWKREKEGK